MDLETIRREYLQGGLRRKDLNNDPMRQFECWMEQAIASKIPDPTAMTLATVNENHEPSQRIVLLKHTDSDGFIFFTNYASEKGKNIADNVHVSLHFPWHFMERQISVSGIAEKLSAEHSAAYFVSRPRESQLGTWASNQSQVIQSRDDLEQVYSDLEKQYAGKNIPLPPFWGGYKVKPYAYEFWQGGAKRLHDRFRYVMSSDAEGPCWRIERLSP